MPDDLNLSLPDRTPKPRPHLGSSTALLVLVLIFGAANLVVSLLGRPAATNRAAKVALPADDQKDLALKLERQGLRAPAAGAWREYLADRTLDATEQAKIWYRIGKLHQEAGDNEKALDAYYRSESLAVVDELAPEIARRTQECLESLGKFAALRNELADRVGIDRSEAPAGEEVVAEIGKQKITKARLDQMVEEQVDRQLARYAAQVPPEQLNKQKEAMLKQFASPQARVQMLQQYIGQELLYREAREARLADEPATRELLHDIEKSVLAQKAMERELADKIKITPTDVQTYYEAHKKDYMQPERAQISHILVKDAKSAAAALTSLKKGAKFAELAKQLSEDAATKDKGGEVAGWVNKGSYIPGIGLSDDATAAIFATEAGKVADKAVKTDKGHHIILVRKREPERQKTFDEVQREVLRALRTRKQREVQQALIERLKDKHNVVIHLAEFRDKKPDAKAPSTATGAATKPSPKAK